MSVTSTARALIGHTILLYVLSVNVVIFIFLCADCQHRMAIKKPPEQLVVKVVF
jgi:hypothetical protein